VVAVAATLLAVLPAYAQTPTETATVTPTPTTTGAPAPAPVPGGSIQVISTADAHGVGGDSVDGGEFEILNTTASTESVSAIRLEVSDLAVFSSLTLTTVGGSVTVESPSTENEFIFFPPLKIPPGSSIALTLSATIESAPESSATPTPSASPVPTSTATPSLSLSITGLIGRGPTTPSSPPPGGDRTSRGVDVLGIGIAMVGLLTGILGRRRRRRWSSLAGLTLLLGGIALYGGCGGEQTSEQSVTDLTVTIPTGPATMTGLPVSLGTVSRPLPLVFPGAFATPQ
jgi:hypothetical protein